MSSAGFVVPLAERDWRARGERPVAGHPQDERDGGKPERVVGLRDVQHGEEQAHEEEDSDGFPELREGKENEPEAGGKLHEQHQEEE